MPPELGDWSMEDQSEVNDFDQNEHFKETHEECEECGGQEKPQHFFKLIRITA